MRRTQRRVKERPIAAFRSEPLRDQLRLHVNRLGGTLIQAGRAAITSHQVYLVPTLLLLNRIKAADFRADTTTLAAGGIDHGF